MNVLFNKKQMLRPYQQQLVKLTSESIFVKGNNRVIFYAPTGSGKTVMAKHMINGLLAKGYSCLFTVPRRKLTFQTQKSFGFGNILMFDETVDNGSNLTIATIHSIYSRKHDKQYDFIFIDEGHYADNSDYINYIKQVNKNAKIICLTATPIDSKGYLIDGYKDVIKHVDIQDLINLGFLVDVEVYTAQFQPDLSDVDVVDGDYNQRQASEKLRDAKVLTNAIDEYKKHYEGRKTLAFACDIDHAEKLKSELSKIEPTGIVHSRMGEEEIKQQYDKFDKNEYKILVNVDMATFGFDQPDIECLFFARPVKSLRLYKQMIGRGLRIANNKNNCLIIDCANVISDNGYPTEPLILEKKPVVSKKVDKFLNIERDTDGEFNGGDMTRERFDYLQKISSLLDLYADKVYPKEQDLIDDLRTFLKKTGFFHWRQNSGVMKIESRYVHFTDKKGLPDLTLLYAGVFYVGLEAKLPRGRLTPNQKATIPEMIEKKCLVFIIESVFDLFEVIEHLNKHVESSKNGVKVSQLVYNYPVRQVDLFGRLFKKNNPLQKEIF